MLSTMSNGLTVWNFMFSLLKAFDAMKDSEEMYRAPKDGPWEDVQVPSEHQILKSDLSNWLFSSFFIFQPAHRLPESPQNRFDGAEREALQSITRDQLLPQMNYNDWDRPCVDGHVLYEAVANASNRTQEAVNALLFFLGKLRTAEDVQKEEPKLALQVCRPYC